MQADERLRDGGPNELKGREPRTAIGIFLKQFRDFMILVLIAAAILAGLMGDIVDTLIIAAIVLANAVIGTVQEHRAERAMQALKRMAAPSATVLREGRVRTVPAREVVVGDIVLLEAGQIVPADLRLLESHGLRMQEAALTGESGDVAKHSGELDDEGLPLGDRTNMVYKGTVASGGRGRGVVVTIGPDTEMGRIARLLEVEPAMTPLQRRMSVFGRQISYAVLSICAVLFLVGYLRGEDPMRLLLTSISLAVAAIPEALPALMSVALALSARRMVKQNALVRRLAAVEALGSVTHICTDKTGTLTQNRMRVERLIPVPLNDASLDQERLLHEALALSNDVTIHEDGRAQGDGTELALHAHARAAGFDKSRLEHAMPRVAELGFDAERKRMSTFHRRDGQIVLFIKGALEVLLERCRNNDPGTVKWCHEQASAMAQDGQRVLAIGFRRLDLLPDPATLADAEEDITLLGLVGLADPPRPEAAKAVMDCHQAGIRPVMITGDHPGTARSIALRIGLIPAEEAHLPDTVIDGKVLAALSPEDLQKRVGRIRVYARVSPEQKLDIVNALQRQGHFVAMTGDGVNDAPALKRADIGVAMGITGTDVAKEASDMILLDDDFATLAHAVREGRRVFDNILKFIKYILTGNSGEIWAIALAPMIGLPIPLLPIHILWVNLVSDGLPGLALAMEPAEPGVMRRRPRHPGENVFSRGIGTHIIWVGLLLGAITLGIQAWAIEHDIDHWQTMAFNVLCLAQMGHVLAIRSDRSFFGRGALANPWLYGAVALTFVLQALITYVPFLQRLFHTEALTWQEFVLVGAVSTIVFIAVEVEKSFKRRRATSPPVT